MVGLDWSFIQLKFLCQGLLYLQISGVPEIPRLVHHHLGSSTGSETYRRTDVDRNYPGYELCGVCGFIFPLAQDEVQIQLLRNLLISESVIMGLGGKLSGAFTETLH